MQLHAYHHCLDAFSTRHEWLGFIDSDEYIFLTNPHFPRLHDLLTAEFAPYAGLAVNWKVYGSSGHLQRPNGAQTTKHVTTTTRIIFRHHDAQLHQVHGAG